MREGHILGLFRSQGAFVLLPLGRETLTLLSLDQRASHPSVFSIALEQARRSGESGAGTVILVACSFRTRA